MQVGLTATGLLLLYRGDSNVPSVRLSVFFVQRVSGPVSHSFLPLRLEAGARAEYMTAEEVFAQKPFGAVHACIFPTGFGHLKATEFSGPRG